MSILEKDGEERIAANELWQEVNRATEKAAPPPAPKEAPGSTANQCECPLTPNLWGLGNKVRDKRRDPKTLPDEGG